MGNIKCILFFIACLMMACSDSEETIDGSGDSNIIQCDNFVTALLEQNEDSLLVLVNRELGNFTFLDQDNNVCLHDNNLQSFAELTKNCTKLEASVICCGCIDSSPAISEIDVKVDSFGIVVTRVLDLFTPNEQGSPLSFAGVHR